MADGDWRTERFEPGRREGAANAYSTTGSRMKVAIQQPSPSAAEPDVPVRVLVAEDHPLMLEAIIARLERSADVRVVGTAADGTELVRRHDELRPDVAVCDYNLPKMSGLEAMVSILASEPDAKILILTAYDDPALVSSALAAGAAGYLLKSVTGEELVSSVYAAVRGDCGLNAATTRLVVRQLRERSRPLAGEPGAWLSKREREVLSLVANGCSNPEIGRRLYIAVETVKTHLDHAYAKLGVSDRASAVSKALRLGLLD